MNKKYVRPFLLVLTMLVLTGLACQFALSPLLAAPTVAPQIQAPAGAPVIQTSADLVSQQDAMVSLYHNSSPGVVSITVTTDVGGAQGSGFVYDGNGHVITNYHVVEGANYIEVDFPSGFKAVGTVIGQDLNSDIAVIHVDAPASELHPLTLGDSGALQVGQYVVAIGNPFGLHGSMSTGIVSSLGRTLDSMNQTDQGSVFSAGDLIQTDAAINPGNSGGPLLDLNGEVVGINRAIRTYSSTDTGDALNSGVGFAVSSNIVKRVVPSLISQGHFDYPYLGISAVPELTLAEAQQLGLSQSNGALIQAVTPNGPAEQAGLQARDFITAIDGRPIMNFDELISYLFREKSPGDTVVLGIERNNQQMDVNLVLGTRPE